MNSQNTLTIHGISDSIAHCEAMGLSKILSCYATSCAGETIESIGFNPNSGYTYLALENGIQIVSMLGRDVEFLTVQSTDGCERWHDSYEEALASPYVEEEEEEEEEDWIDHSDSEDY